MAGILKDLQKFRQSRVVLDRGDIGSRHNDILNPQFAKAQQVAEHQPLLRRKTLSGDLFVFKCLFDNFARILWFSRDANASQQPGQPAWL